MHNYDDLENIQLADTSNLYSGLSYDDFDEADDFDDVDGDYSEDVRATLPGMFF